MHYFQKVKEITRLNISDSLLTSLVFEMSRFSDKEFTAEVQRIQKDNNVVLDTPTRRQLRKKFYYGDIISDASLFPIKQCDYDSKKIEEAFEDCYNRLNTYDPVRIIESMKKRVAALEGNISPDCHMKDWLKNFESRRKNKLYSFVCIRVDQESFKESDYNESILTNLILKTYDSLENYRYLALIIQGELFDRENKCVTWELLYKAGIYAENFIQYKNEFFPFHKSEQIDNLTHFLNERKIKNASKLAEDLYSCISTGYRFEDCYISDNQDCKIALFKKIELDPAHIPCPSCNTIIQSGNSYPELFLRSWECKNPECPDRSKSGRGKRFDEYGVYRYFKLVENNKDNRIDDKLYQAFRRDVFNHENDWIKFLIKEYTYSKEKVFMYNINIKHKYNRIPVEFDPENLPIINNAVSSYPELPIVSFYRNVLKNITLNKGSSKLTKDLEIINDNSTSYIQSLKPGQIGTAITSPPYYNAREYSQWETMIMYFVDMIINCKVVYNSLARGGYYLYNIGDIVSEDNIYVKSNMSKHRVQLGFWSSMIFEIAGYTLTGNIIWDKGEVQSRRNSTVNLFSGYVKCINCYEHILVFRKGDYEKLSNSVERITPVIKINSKGENTYKHTAPYPIELVNLIKPYLDEKRYVLDPFLGSGTTLKWCKKTGTKGVGTELDKEYFELCKKNIFESNDQITVYDIM